MTESILQMENFLLNHKEDGLSQLVKGTDEYYFFYFLIQFNEHGFNLKEEDQAMLGEYLKFETQKSSQIGLRAKFLEYDKLLEDDSEQSKIKRTKIISKLAQTIFEIDCSHEKFQRIQQIDVEQSQKEQNTLKQLFLNEFIDNAYNCLKEFLMIESCLYCKLDLQRLSQCDPEIIKYFVMKVGDEIADFQNVPQFVLNVKKNLSQNEIQVLYHKLTYDQMEEIYSHKESIINEETFFDEYVIKRFVDIQQYKEQSPQGKLGLKSKLLNVLKWAEGLPQKLSFFRKMILQQILYLGIEQNDFDFEIFVRYIEDPYEIFNEASDYVMEKIRTQKKQKEYPYFYEIPDDVEIIKEYLSKYFEKSNDLTCFEKFINISYLEQIKAETQLYCGKEVQNIYEHFTKKKIQQLRNERLLTLCPHNQQYFNHGEIVSLSLELKNIQTLTIRLFQLNLENYYLQTKRELNLDSVNLDGLIPQFQQTFYYSQSPIEKFKSEFTFDVIANCKRGAFIIEFMGNGVMSKALIQKGNLAIVSKLTSVGHALQIVDESFDICCGERTGLWLDNRFYEVDKQRKEIIIPYGQSKQQLKSTLVHGDFAKVVDFTIEGEEYQFKCLYFLSNEQLLLGSTVTALIYPKLFINQMQIDNDILENISISLGMVDEEGIMKNKEFTQFNSKEELEIEFKVNQRLSSLHIRVSAKIQLINKNVNPTTNISDIHYINMNDNVRKSYFCHPYLKFTQNNGYEAYLLGKDGEPKSNIDVIISQKLNGIQQVDTQYLKSDEKGKVQLGKLENIVYLNYQVMYQGDIQCNTQKWILINNSQTIQKKDLKYLTGELIMIPYIKPQNQNQFATLIKIENENNSVIKSLSHLVSYHNNSLQFTIEEVGLYKLLIHKQGEISIEIVQGHKWLNGSQIISNKKLISQNNEVKQLIISNLKNENNTISGDIQYYSKPRLIAFATQFINQNFRKLQNQIQKTFHDKPLDVIALEDVSNRYQSNIVLSSESNYIKNRKIQEKYIGNNLEKPQFLLKKKKIGQTQTLQEENEQTDVTIQPRKWFGTKACRLQSSVQQIRKLDRDGWDCEAEVMDASVNSDDSYKIDGFQNFLSCPGMIIQDIALTDDGHFSFDVSTQYGSVILIAFNQYNSVIQQIGLISDEIPKRRQTHQSTFEKDKFYSVFRNKRVAKKGQSITIHDIISTEVKIIDSLDKLFTVFKELRKCHNTFKTQEPKLTDWEFLPKWHSKTLEQKHLIYDQFQSDELNIFLYFKDPVYCQMYIKTYIKNKIEKSFIDWFILQNQNKMNEFSHPQNLMELNPLEQTLLVIYFSEIQIDKTQAQNIASYIENYNKTLQVSQKQYKILFDTTLGVEIEVEQTDPIMVQKRLLIKHNPSLDDQVRFEQPERRRGGARTRQTARKSASGKLGRSQQNTEENQNEYNDMRGNVIQNFKNIEPTCEYAEQHYFNSKQLTEHKTCISMNQFWVNVANHSSQVGILKGDPFLTHNFIVDQQNNSESIAMLALINLPFESPTHTYKAGKNNEMDILFAHPTLLLTKEIREGQANLRNDILVIQRFIDEQYVDVQEDDPEQKIEKEVTEFIVDRIYKCDVIVTNCTFIQAEYQVLVEIPNGAIPVHTLYYTKSFSIIIESYSNFKIQYYFYFPNIGQFTIYPANVSRFGQVVCKANDQIFDVKKSKTIKNKEQLNDILSIGNKQDILDFLRTKNIFNENLFTVSQILYLFSDKEFYLQAIEIFRKRKFIDFEVWQYSTLHGDHESLKEFFNIKPQNDILKKHFQFFQCSLFKCNAIRFYEYFPLIVKRAHKLNENKNNILNIEFISQYSEFLQYLIQKGHLELSDKLVFIYYLLLQERINEAIFIYKSIIDVPADGDSILQYNYFTAYLDFYIGYPNFIKARAICEKYMNYPIIHWRNLFYEIINQLVEYDGEDDENQKLEVEQTQKNKQLDQARQEETLTSVIEGNNIIVTYSNLSSVTLQFYKIDLEVLFSSNPFLNKSSEDFSFVLPNLQIVEQLKGEQQEGLTYKQTIEIPEQLRSNNLFVQIKGISKSSSNRYFSTSLNVQIMENYGQIRVADSKGKYLAKIYVKAYIKEKNGAESFYKDGYTDLRGRFDYASLSSAQLENVEKFSIFIASDELGSVIKEVNAPAQVGQFQAEVKLISKAWNQRAEIEQNKQTQIYAQQMEIEHSNIK